jgi:hypothetical protein
MANVRVREPKRGHDDARNAAPKSPDVHTRWVRDKESRIRQMQQQGYVPATEDDIRKNHDGWQTPEGVIRNGDLILMKCDKARYEKKRDEIREFNEHRERSRLSKADEIRDEAGFATLEQE